MLKNNIFKFKFFRFIQSGLYIDFILKNFIEIFLKNFLVYSSIFFGEKFLIEFLTKKIIDNIIFNFNKKKFYDFFEVNFLNQIVFLFMFTILVLFFINNIF